VPSREADLVRALDRVEEECRRLAGLLASGETLPSVLEVLREREARRVELRAELAHLRGAQRVAATFDVGGLRAELGQWLADWRELLEGEPVQARQVLRKLLVSRLVWTPRVETGGAFYDYAADVSYGKLLAGVVPVRSMVPPG